MASILCSSGHVHTSVEDVKRCSYPAAGPSMAPSGGSGHPANSTRSYDDPASPRQLSYIDDLGGDPLLCASYTWSEASKVIANLLVSKGRKSRMAAPTPPPTPVAPTRSESGPTETKVVLPMLQYLPDGYYAWTPGLDSEVTFVRVKRYEPSARNRWAGSTLIQTQHSDELLPAWCLWPSGHISRYRQGRNGVDIETVINGLIVDYKECARRYSQLKNQCFRCRKDLTDPRSRHYGIGPECEKHNQWAISEVDDQNDGVPWERLADSK